MAVHSGRSKDLEIIVLRHQLTVLHRQNNRPALADEGRALLGAVAAALIGTMRRELLDRTIIWNQRQLEHLVTDYIDHYNTQRPHRSLNQRPRALAKPPNANGQQRLRIIRATRCGGLINEYRRAA